MNISSKGRYALQALFDLASHSTDEPVKIASIAKRQKIPRKFLESILSSLKQGGFVESHRGVAGGYNLARASGNNHGWPGAEIVDGPRGNRRATSARPHFSDCGATSTRALPGSWTASISPPSFAIGRRSREPTCRIGHLGSPAPLYTSKFFTSSAFSSMNLRRLSTSSP